jgi:hypothetical protein
MQRRLPLDVVVGQRAAILKLLAGEDQALLVLLVSVFMTICMPPRRRSTRCSVDSFWKL